MASPARGDDDDEWDEYWFIRPPGWMKNYHTAVNWTETETVKVRKGFRFCNFMQEPKDPKPDDTTEG